MARRGNRYGYGGYHGRSRGKGVLKVIIAVLAVVLLLVLGLFFLQENHLAFSSDGAHLSLPFFGGDEVLPEPEVSEPVVVTTAPTPTPTPTPTPEPPTQAALLPRSALKDGTAPALLGEAGANTAVFDMKADDGTLGYVSNLELAKQAGASASDPELNQAIENWNAGNVYTVARVSCFRDNKVPYAVPALGVKTNSGYNWRDQDDLRWMSPSSEEARAYIVDVCVELAELGFDEILLDNSAYPVQGHLEYIKRGENYDQSKFQETITAFYTQVETALAAYPDVKLSIRTEGEVLVSGQDAVSGQSAAALAEHADRIWVDLGEVSLTAAAEALGGNGAEEKLVPILGTAGGAGEAWANLNTTEP